MCRSSGDWCTRSAFHLVEDSCLRVLPAMLLHICSTYERLVNLLLSAMIIIWFRYVISWTQYILWHAVTVYQDTSPS